jgi:hypothetical protein
MPLVGESAHSRADGPTHTSVVADGSELARHELPASRQTLALGAAVVYAGCSGGPIKPACLAGIQEPPRVAVMDSSHVDGCPGSDILMVASPSAVLGSVSVPV